MNFIDISGNRYGKLVALERLNIKSKNGVIWRCICDCGNEKNVLSSHLRRNSVESCGCVRKRTMKKKCKYCGDMFVIPICRDWREHCCSSECKINLKKKLNEEGVIKRTRSCLSCGSKFSPRNYQIKTGQGKYCSKACLFKEMIKKAHTPEANQKRAKRYKEVMEGKYLRGENHPKWKGGQKATIRRAIESGVMAERIRKYRERNKHRVREWASARKNRKTGRLPRGTVSNLLILQKNKCVVCRKNIEKNYHVDHITPLKLGGKHEPNNIQLLCPSCNVKKNAKDPIKFMQERGFLL